MPWFGILLIWLLQVWCVSCQDRSGQCSQDNGQALFSGANDVIVVKQSDGELRSTAIQMQVGKLSTWWTLMSSRFGSSIKVFVNGVQVHTDRPLVIHEQGVACFQGEHQRHNFTDSELRRMRLQRGMNPAVFVIDSLSLRIPFAIFLMHQSDRLVITDIDGTITKSDIRGYVFPQLGVDHHQDHVVELLQKIAANGYTIVYLTARSMAMSQQTKQYLFQNLQNKHGFSLPPGPVLSSPVVLSTAIWITDPSDTKAAHILSILNMFDLKQQVVMAAYGNQKSDQVAYEKSGISNELIYLTDEEGQLTNAGQKSTYAKHVVSVSQMFPSFQP